MANELINVLLVSILHLIQRDLARERWVIRAAPRHRSCPNCRSQHTSTMAQQRLHLHPITQLNHCHRLHTFSCRSPLPPTHQAWDQWISTGLLDYHRVSISSRRPDQQTWVRARAKTWPATTLKHTMAPWIWTHWSMGQPTPTTPSLHSRASIDNL
jgi:hypothetical protein